jgi:basic membrane protein A
MEKIFNFGGLPLAVFSLVLAVSCQSKTENTGPATSGSSALKVGLVLDRGGKDDKSFNSAAYAGSKKAADEHGFELKVVEASDTNSFEPLLKGLAEKGFSPIVAVGFVQAEPVKKLSTAYPKTLFITIDAEVNAPNVTSLLFEEHEGSFLVGVIAGWKSQTKKVGFIGGMDIPMIRRFQMGYEAGVKYADPKIETVGNMIGVTSEAWNNTPKATQIALDQYERGVDVIFAAAGASAQGVFNAAETKKKFAIGVDSNQNWIKPGLILTSMLKKVDVAVYDSLSEFKKTGTLKAGVQRYGIANNGVDYALDEHNQSLISDDWKKKLDSIKADIVAGKIQVPDYYKTNP